MPALIDIILSIEQQANDIVAKAQADAKAITARTESEITDARKRISAETDARLTTCAQEMNERQARELADVESELHASLAAIDGIAPSTLHQFSARVAEAFQRE
ncbi:MAG: hypothetical protein IT366_00315 [Candidatus Hydrogenedentes bacterium]|nr:hypothetical protein [Candidatus Hydrogenedentota bacterium]